jgi:hypothetical protein
VLFVIFYALLRIPIDLLREYPITMWGLPTGQTLNLITVFIGVILLGINAYRARSYRGEALPPKKIHESRGGLVWRGIALAVCLLIPLVIPSDATRDIPATYGVRHQGLEYSWMYPRIAEDLKKSANASPDNQ